LETLEPEAPDSFFNWNFFDSILQQKEHFSSYLFEDTAEDLLRVHEWLKDSLENRRNTDEDFRKDSRTQLDFIYRNSPHFDDGYKKYPVYRILK
jgi:hypothetical protein